MAAKASCSIASRSSAAPRARWASAAWPAITAALPDQSAARDGFILYSATPAAPLKAGEYALVLYTGEMRTAGFFSQNANSYFDFGVN